MVLVPSPSLAPTPSATLKPQGLEAQINEFQQKMQAVDLKENELTPPSLDFNIRFEVE